MKRDCGFLFNSGGDIHMGGHSQPMMNECVQDENRTW